MTTLVLGASGATGRKLVEQLLNRDHSVKVIVRLPKKLPDSWKNNDWVSIIEASVLEIGEDKMAEHLKDCLVGASCLGHNLSLKGLFGKP